MIYYNFFKKNLLNIKMIDLSRFKEIIIKIYLLILKTIYNNI